MREEKTADDAKAIPVRWFVLFCVALVACQAILGAAVWVVLPDWKQRAAFGDMFGVASAAFSGLAFAGVIYAILLQRQELSLQRQELRLTREELRRTAAAQERSESALSRQATALLFAARINALDSLMNHKLARTEVLQAMGETHIAEWRQLHLQLTTLVNDVAAWAREQSA